MNMRTILIQLLLVATGCANAPREIDAAAREDSKVRSAPPGVIRASLPGPGGDP